jgi:hypothetical protein
VSHTARVTVESRDRPRRVAVPGGGTQGAASGASGTRARNVNRREPALGSAQEAVKHIARVFVVSGDRPVLVEVPGVGALAETSGCDRVVNRLDRAVESAQVAVVQLVIVYVPSQDHPQIIDPEGACAHAPRIRDCASARSVERDDSGLLSACGKGQPQHAQGQAKGERSFPSECRTELVKSNMVRHN